MTFHHLEDTLVEEREEDLEAYLKVFSNLRDPTKTVLGYTLDIGSYLKSLNLEDSYLVFGGYAVLSHMMNTFGESIAPMWRGSVDIDMAGTPRVLTALKSGYDMKSDLLSPNISEKRTLKLVEDHEPECKIDFYVGDYSKKYSIPETNFHFGIPLRVASPLALIKSKLNTPKNEMIHSYDILTLLTVLERLGKTPEEVLHFFSINDQIGDLNERVKDGLTEYADDRLGVFPSDQFIKQLKNGLHKHRPIPLT